MSVNWYFSVADKVTNKEEVIIITNANSIGYIQHHVQYIYIVNHVYIR